MNCAYLFYLLIKEIGHYWFLYIYVYIKLVGDVKDIILKSVLLALK